MPSPRKAEGARAGHRSYPMTVIDPDAQVDVPTCPSGMLKRTREAWDAFWRSDAAKAVDTNSDLYALERWIQYVDERERSMTTLRKYRLVKGSMGQPTLSPLAKYVAQLESWISDLERQFGMKPLARVSLGLVAGEGQLTAAKLNAMMGGGRGRELTPIEGHAHEIEAGDGDDEDDVEWVAG